MARPFPPPPLNDLVLGELVFCCFPNATVNLNGMELFLQCTHTSIANVMSRLMLLVNLL